MRPEIAPFIMTYSVVGPKRQSTNGTLTWGLRPNPLGFIAFARMLPKGGLRRPPWCPAVRYPRRGAGHLHPATAGASLPFARVRDDQLAPKVEAPAAYGSRPRYPVVPAVRV